ncbi:MAG TPA: rod shape-determining protein MreC [Candidatus Acidoferrales bacterium]|jgi:rod shape-determining protein MreC|nr:rod shape-determining protein MreC [Candidatus Acidoferrales bacterium]
MVAIPSKHRSLTLLAAVLLAQMLMLAVQIKVDSRGRLIRVWAISAAYPFERSGAWGFGKVGGVWNHYFALRNTVQENEALRIENDALKLTISQLQTRAAEADRLAGILGFKQTHEQVPMVGARVIAASAGTASRTIEVDRGERDGIRRNMAVITPDGAVGKVIEVYRDTAQVLLLTDKDGGAGAMLVDSRTQGVVGGTGEPMIQMKYVANEDIVNVGEKIVTSGMDKIFPKDIPVGTVVESKSGNTFKQIRVEPAARLDRLEAVIVLLSQEPVEFKNSAQSAQSGSASNPSSAQSATPASAEKP